MRSIRKSVTEMNVIVLLRLICWGRGGGRSYFFNLMAIFFFAPAALARGGADTDEVNTLIGIIPSALSLAAAAAAETEEE